MKIKFYDKLKNMISKNYYIKVILIEINVS